MIQKRSAVTLLAVLLVLSAGLGAASAGIDGALEDRTTGEMTVGGATDDDQANETEQVDDEFGFNVSQSAARATADAVLSDQPGEWELVESSVHEDDGYYEFEYSYDGTGTGEAEVRVDGASGTAFRVEEEIESEDGEEHEREERTRDDDSATEEDEDEEEDDDEADEDDKRDGDDEDEPDDDDDNQDDDDDQEDED